MLYSLQVVVTLPFLILSFILGAKVYQSGFNAGVKGVNHKQEPMIFPKKQKKPVVPKEIERMNKVLENIERYDGSEIGQEDIV